MNVKDILSCESDSRHPKTDAIQGSARLWVQRDYANNAQNQGADGRANHSRVTPKFVAVERDTELVFKPERDRKA